MLTSRKPLHLLTTILLIVPLACSKNNTKDAITPKIGIADTYENFTRTFASDYEKLELPPLELSYKENLKHALDAQDLPEKLKILNHYQKRLDSLNINTLNICQKIDVAKLKWQLHLDTRWAQLAIDFQAEMAKAETQESTPDTGIHTLPMGKQWYLHYLQNWLEADVTIEEALALGETEFATAVENYRAVQKELGFENNDLLLEVHLSNPIFYMAHDDALLRLFEQKQKTVQRNMETLFTPRTDIPTTIIAKSNRGASFPAPGYYEATEQTFYYNVFNGIYDTRDADWLYLHEAIPGHHYQFQLAEKNASCNATLDKFYGAYQEGWAAYVETLGEPLGLYQRKEQKLAALSWDMVRSARVILDIRMNYDGWGNEQALAWWKANVILQDGIAIREVERMRNWPGQVITYKYGSAFIENMKNTRMEEQGDAFDIRTFHDDVLKYGPMPMSILKTVYTQ